MCIRDRCMVEDLYKIQKQFKKRFPDRPYYILGHSMGSFLTRYFLIEHGESVDGAIIMGTGYHPPVLTAVGCGLARVIAAVKGWHFRSQFINKMAFEMCIRDRRRMVFSVMVVRFRPYNYIT